MSKKEIYQRVKKVNDTLRSRGLSWDEIEVFWNECIKKSKKESNE